MIFISILTLIVAKALPFLKHHISPVHFTRISALIFLYSSVLTFNMLYIQSIGSGIGIYSGLFQVTVISQYMELFLFLIGFIILIAWPLNSGGSVLLLRRVTELKTESPDYCLIVLFSTLGSCLLVSSSDLVSMYLSIELQSFGLYVLSTLYRDSESSTKAGLKYFLLGGLSSCFILLGSGLIYAFTGLTQFESIYSLISALVPEGVGGQCALRTEINNIIQGLSLGIILIIIGFLFKIAAAPLHNWSPDVYDETPTIVTIWLTIMPKIAILILLLEIQTQIGVIGSLNNVLPSDSIDLIKITPFPLPTYPFSPEGVGGGVRSPFFFEGLGLGLDTIVEGIGVSHGAGFAEFEGVPTSLYLLKNLLLISSLLSLIIGTVVGLAQTRIKRLFAYSTISHIGFILLALAINSEQSIESFLFYIIQYSITNLDVFLIILALGYIIYPLRSVPSTKCPALPFAPFNSPLAVWAKARGAYAGGLMDTPSSKSRGGQEEGPLSSEKGSVESVGRGGVNYNYLTALAPSEGAAPSPLKGEGQGENKGNIIKDIRYISELKGQFFLNPLLSLSLSICLFSMAGIPPLIGFFSKQFVLSSALQSGYYFIAFVAILVSVVSASYYLKIIKVLLLNTNNTNTPFPKAGLKTKTSPLLAVADADRRVAVSNFHSFLISTLTLSILLFISKSSLILNSTQLLSLSLFYF
uniref:NADH-ubiquinone oxidoreductase chain 2 n=1 Tax=Termitomyces sp. TaxID=1916073 RepID=A0A386TYB0_9AGAR|nr:NADH dehydrogenase subunit 2 [Termitomyces sp.]AYE93274.1 NADH dehydrogenase subunit 2 [Termitomyces sp.]